MTLFKLTLHRAPLAAFLTALKGLRQPNKRTSVDQRALWVTSPLRAQLRERRYANIWTLDKLSQVSGYSKQTLRSWETGKSVPSESQLNDWQQALEVA